MRRAFVVLALAVAAANQRAPARMVGLTAGAEVAQAYDAILDADFASLPARLSAICGPAPPEVCRTLDALGIWWQIALEPESLLLDVKFSRTVDEAIDAADRWTRREPRRAEAWFYLGAAHGARAQWRVLRKQRVAAARDGGTIKAALERALMLDPELADAKFGLGMYRYYASVAPTFARVLRWLFFLPGGDREDGLRQINAARDRGQVVRGEAEYQLHLIYLWYEKRWRDALVLIEGLQRRYPHNPLFYQREAEIEDVYSHDAAASLAASTALLERATSGRVHEPDLASVRARLNMAVQLDRLGQRARAHDLLDAIVAERPTRPYGSTARAHALLQDLRW